MLPYPDIEPEAWAAVPAGPDSFHLVWREHGGGLYNALIDLQGQTLRGPIRLSLPVNARFEMLPLSGGQGLILAWEPGDPTVTGAVIDSTGRPRITGSRAFASLQMFTAGIDSSQNLHAVWIVLGAGGTAELYYSDSSLDSFFDASLPVPAPLTSIDLSEMDTITSLDLGTDASYGYVLVGITSADRPDAERVLLLNLPLSDPSAAVTSTLALPSDLAAWNDAALFVPAAEDRAALLRWPRFAQGQSAQLRAVVAIRTVQGWQPVLVAFDAGHVVAAGIAAEDAVDGGPITAAIDGDSDPVLVWTSLQNTEPHLLAAAADFHDASPDLSATILAGMAGLPLAALWLALPTMMLIVASKFPNAALWIASALYAALKLLFPSGLFQCGPALLLALDATSISVPVVTVLLIALIAASAYRLSVRFSLPLWARWIVYGAADALLTWLAFGANTTPH
ncbi:MAG TPA: hypothetical protein PKD09_00135 [Aggregatilinea sp.]|uniref:hypothetical protein n=1 Tax=Aggregatilinea sp. TaxID=2806333 RepID=UPI002B6B545E|nr:hypothetical protein [Aggregatilinea sp.]HML20022.1 hypothetical protein [Aggregatilinea sp.]